MTAKQFMRCQLGTQPNLVDFSSNDYLGFSKNESVFNNSHAFLIDLNLKRNGATGARLLSGNHPLFEVVERRLSSFHKSETALIYNSGYDANVGFFQAFRNVAILLYLMNTSTPQFEMALL